MSITLAEVFDEHFSRVKFDNKLAKACYNYQIGYLNSNREYMEFFGSNLLGVHVIRFKDSDVVRLFSDVLDVDFIALTKDIRTVTTINHDYKVSGDVFNLTLMYVIHKFLTSKLISDTVRHRACYDVGLIFFYRTISALINSYFSYPADPKIAQVAYANLSYKFLIKKLGTWHKVMEYRANDLIDKQSIHYNALLKFNDDNGIVYAINDAQGRIRDLIKNYYSEFKKVHVEGSKILTTSSTILDIEGKETLKEKTKSTESHVGYIRSIINDRHSFIRDDLVGVIASINTNSSFRMIKSVLTWLSDSYSDPKYNKDIDKFLSTTIIHSFYLVQNSMNISNMRDYPNILINLKNLYLSTRSTDQDLMVIKELGEKIVRHSQEDKISESLILATRTSIILYIMLRTLVGINR